MIAGQLASGMDSLACFSKGAEIMTRFHTEALSSGDQDQQTSLAEQLSSAYCSMAEIFMTDCCFEEGAEEECTRLIEQAVEWRGDNVEAHLLRAQCSLAKSDPESALAAIQISFSLWKEREDEDLPAYTVRVSTAKILIEVNLLEDATDVCPLWGPD
jgi:hypothetical protein